MVPPSVFPGRRLKSLASIKVAEAFYRNLTCVALINSSSPRCYAWSGTLTSSIFS